MKIPTLTSSRTLPTSQRTGFRQVAEEMDSAIGNVLQGLGAKLDEANKKQERTKALVDFSDWERETKQGLQNLRQTTTEDEPHYAERANSFITNQENKFEEKLPADLQDEFSIRSQFLGDSLRLSEGTHDLERKASYAQTQIQLDLEKRKQTVGEDHTTLQSEKLRLGELITNADTSDAAKALALREGSRQLTTVAYNKAYEYERRSQQYSKANIRSYVDLVIAGESGDDAEAVNSKSSATGAGQFIKSTWTEFIKAKHPELLAEDYQKLRTNKDLSREAVAWYADENGRMLHRANLPVNPGSLRLAHFAGGEGAIDILSAAPSTPIENIVSPAVMKANPFLEGKTAQDVVERFYNEMGLDSRTSAVDEDPTYSEVEYADRLTIQKSVDAMLRAESSSIERAREEERVRDLNDLYQGLNNGTYSMKDLAEANKVGMVENYSEFARGQAILTAKDKAFADRRYATGIMLKGQKGSAKDTKYMNGVSDLYGQANVDKLYNQDPAQNEILQEAFTRAGVVPRNAMNALASMSSSHDWASQKYALDILKNLQDTNFTDFSNQSSNELAERVQTFRAGAGVFPEDLLREATSTPKSAEEHQRRTVNKAAAAELIKDEYEQEDIFNKFTEYFRLGEQATAIPGAQQIGFYQNFKSLFSAYYTRLGDQKLAETSAIKMMQRSWGFHSADGRNVLMEHPPEVSGYQQFDESFDYIAEQVQSFAQFPEGSLYNLIPDEKTRNAVHRLREQGMQEVDPTEVDPVDLDALLPSYQVVWWDENGSPHYVPGRVTFGITAEMKADLVERQAQSVTRVNLRELKREEERLLLMRSLATRAFMTSGVPVDPLIQEQLEGVEKEIGRVERELPQKTPEPDLFDYSTLEPTGNREYLTDFGITLARPRSEQPEQKERDIRGVDVENQTGKSRSEVPGLSKEFLTKQGITLAKPRS